MSLELHSNAKYGGSYEVNTEQGSVQDCKMHGSNCGLNWGD